MQDAIFAAMKHPSCPIDAMPPDRFEQAARGFAGVDVAVSINAQSASACAPT
jgi:hypothetical protein